MLLPISQLLEGRAKPFCIEQNARVQDALRIMLQNDVSQLPVLDVEGDLVGLISHKTIAHAVFLLGDKVPLLKITVDHCLERVDTLTLEDDVFEACDLLGKGNGSLVVVDERKPVGILTTGDLMRFFRDRSEDFIKIEDIEVTLRLRTRDAFPDDESMRKALLVSLGPEVNDPNKPRKGFNELSLGEMVMVMTHAENWPKFNGMFEPLELFTMLMERVRQVRNLLAHFRGRSDLLQDRTLKYALDWLALRATPMQSGDGPQRAYVTTATEPGKKGKRWDVLCEWLKQQPKSANGLLVSFGNLQTLMGGPLPSSALKHASWWSNTNVQEAQVNAWLDAGWHVANIDFGRKEVLFQPAANAVANEATHQKEGKVV
jgi:CBS domain-containing protein